MSEREPEPQGSSEVQLVAYAASLVAAIEVAIPGWVEAAVGRVWSDWSGAELPAAVLADATAAGALAAAEVNDRLAALFDVDVEAQRSTPLSILRGATQYPAEVLSRHGVAPIVRTEWETAAFPDDAYGLAPGAFSDFGELVHEAGLRWGAAKAFVILDRRRGAAANKVRALVPDLMDRSKVSASARRVGQPVQFVSTADALDDRCDLVLVDLSRPGALDAARRCASSTVVVGFAPHVNDELLAAAATSGIDACARSVFFRRLDQLLASVGSGR